MSDNSGSAVSRTVRPASPIGVGRYATTGEISIDGPLRGYYLRGANDRPDPAACETEIGWPIFRAGSAG